MKNYGYSTLHDFLGDSIVYRSLNPLDKRLPRLQAVQKELTLPETIIPRKSDPEYGQIISSYLELTRKIERKRNPIESILYIGDTRLNDVQAFQHICASGNWKGLAFIACEDQNPPSVEKERAQKNQIIFANRWELISKVFGLAKQQGITRLARTAVLIDIDKTAIGARGRNDLVIDKARFQAARATLVEIIGNQFNLSTFKHAYDTLNLPTYHSFTADNQDYLVYICMILASGLFELDRFEAGARSGFLPTFQFFIEEVDENKEKLPKRAREVHNDIFTLVKEGDTTPFKLFRRNEFRSTNSFIRTLPAKEPADRIIKEEIVITNEVREFALECKKRGALLFGLSDKPDEASLPHPEDKGTSAIHKTRMHSIGE